MSDEKPIPHDSSAAQGTDPAASRVVLFVDDPAERDVAKALTAEVWVPEADLAQRIERSPFYEALSVPVAPLSVHRWRERPQVVLAELVGARGSVSLEGEVLFDGQQLIFPGHASGGAEYVTSEGIFDIRVDAGGRVEIARSADADRRPHDGRENTGDLDDVGPDPALLQSLAEVYAAEHLLALEEEVRERIHGLEQSPASLDRAEALGLVSRAWSPASPRDALARLLAGKGMTPAEALRVWAREAAAEWVEDWQLQALGEAADLAAEERDLGPPVREADRLAFARRRPALRSALLSSDPRLASLALRALGGMIAMGNVWRDPSTRLSIGELHVIDWRPATQDEAQTTLRQLVDLLVEAASVGPPETRLGAHALLAKKAYPLLQWGQLDSLRTYFGGAGLDGSSRVRVLEGMRTFFESETGRQDGYETRHSPEYVSAVRDWQAALSAGTLHERVVDAVGTNWVPLEERDAWATRLAGVAGEVIGDPDALSSELEWLAGPEALQAGPLGRELGRRDRDGLWLDRLVAACCESGEWRLAQGYVAALLQTGVVQDARIVGVLDERQEVSPQVVVWISAAGGLHRLRCLDRALDQWERGRVGDQVLERLSYFQDATPEDLGRLLDVIIRDDRPEKSELALDLIGSHAASGSGGPLLVSSDPEGHRLELVLRRTLGSMAHDWQWAATAGLLVESSPPAAMTLALERIAQTGIGADALVEMLQRLAVEHSEMFLSLFGAALLAERGARALRSTTLQNVVRALPADPVLSWLSTRGPEAASALAWYLPRPAWPEPTPPGLTEQVLERHGDDQGVAEQFFQGTMFGESFFMRDPDLLEEKARNVSAFTGHRLRAVRDWASRYIAALEDTARRWRAHLQGCELY